MTRTLTFTAEDNPKWVLLHNAFYAGGNTLHASAQGQRAPDERRKEAKITRALQSVSVVVDPATGTRRLAPEGGTLSLDQVLHSLLERYVAAAPFPTEVSVELADLLDWLETAPKVAEG